MRITTASGLGAEHKRLWIVQRWHHRGGWFDWSVCTLLKEAEEDYITALKQDESGKHTRIIRVGREVHREAK